MDQAEKSAGPSNDSAANSRDVPFEDLPDGSSDRPQNRRIHPRISVDSDSTLLLVSHGLSLPSHILDLSLDGCRLRTRERYAVAARARVEVAFKVNGIAFRFLGVIQWTDGRHCAGIRFVDMISRRREELAEVIGEVELVTAAKEAKAAVELEAQNDAQSSQESPRPEASRPTTTSVVPQPSQNSPRPEALYQGTTSVVPRPSQNSPRPEALYQGTTSVVPQTSQNSPRPEVLHRGTTSVVPQPSQNSPRPEVLYQGTNSVAAKSSQNSPRPEVLYQGTNSVAAKSSQNSPRPEALYQGTTSVAAKSSQNSPRPEALYQGTTSVAAKSSQNSPRPEGLYQGTTSVAAKSSQNSPRPEGLYQGTTSVVPQSPPHQYRALAPVESPVRAVPSLESTRQAANDPAAKRTAELAAWEAKEWAEIQQQEQEKAEAAEPSQSPNQPPTKRDRRAQSRHPVDTTAAILLIKIGSTLGGRIIDLSSGGCRILCDERFPVGIYTRVETEFRLEGLPFRLGGVIQAIHDRRTVGIRFLDMSGRKREQIEQLIEEIEEARAMPPAVEEPAIEGPG